MDSKEIKSKLKSAREALKNKEYKEALKCCKAVLAHDKNHYNALVFIGVAAEGLEQPDQAVKAYKRAIDIASDQILAWQGLCSFYEKNDNPETRIEHVDVYQRLLKFYDGDNNKKIDTQQKLAGLYGKLKSVEKAVSLYQELLKVVKDARKRREILVEMISLLQQQSTDQEELLISCYKELLSSPEEIEGRTEIVKNYINLLLKSDGKQLNSELNRLIANFKKEPYPLEVFLLKEMDTWIGDLKPNLSSAFHEMVKKLRNINEACPVLMLCDGVKHLADKDFYQTKSLISEGLEKAPTLICGYYYLALTLYHLHDKASAEKVCQQGLATLQRKDCLLTIDQTEVSAAFHVLLAKLSLRHGSSSYLQPPLDLLMEEKFSESHEILVTLGHMYLKQGKIAEAETCLQKFPEDSEQPAVLALTGWAKYHQGKFDEAEYNLKRAVELDGEISEHHLMLALTYWKLRESTEDNTVVENCFTSLLKAAKLDPYNSEVFMYLGHFYSQVQQDSGKAKKCYQKAFDLDAENSEAGAALCDIMMANGEDEKVNKLLSLVTSSRGIVKWAWLRLGLHQMKHEDPTAAVTSFQTVLRVDPQDNHLWECLAEAYLHRGSFTASLKAFTKVSELDPDSLYCPYQIASIKQTLGLYLEAVNEYKIILTKSPNYVPALKGLGETCLQLAKSNLQEFFHGRVLNNCQDAIVYLTRAVSQRPDLSCLWKLLGDACTIIHPLATEKFSIAVPAKLVRVGSGDVEGTLTLHKLELLELGARCYGQSLKILPDCASLWHDLAINNFYQSQYMSGEKATNRCRKAVDLFKKALSLDHSNHSYWNALGVVACCPAYSCPQVAQHCFIKSIKADSNNVVAWTNLGALYLQHNNIKKAHEAFKMAQNLDPMYIACWIGQALIAEMVDHEDAMDLFRHTTELGNHLEGALGYAHWVCTTLQDSSKHDSKMYQYCIEQMAAIPAASDALAKYTDRVKTCPTAFTLYGLLLERQGLCLLAAAKFERALQLLESNGSDEDKLAKVRSNYARVLCSLGQYGASIKQYQAMGSVVNLDDICGLGLALFKIGQFKESYQAYSRALEVTSSDHAYILIAQGSSLLRMGDFESATNLLLKGSQIAPVSAEGLKALCALGLLQGDKTLIKAVLQELMKFKDPAGEHLTDFTWLMAASYIIQGNLKTAKNLIQKAVHKHPGNVSLWVLLGKVLMQFIPEEAHLAAACVQYGQMLEKTISRSSAALLGQSQLAAGAHSVRNCNRNAYSVAMKAYHAHPDDRNCLINLVAAIHAEALVRQCTQQSLDLFHVELSYLHDLLQSTDSSNSPVLTLWLWKEYILTLLIVGKVKAAKLSVAKLLKLPQLSASDTAAFAIIVDGAIKRDVDVVRRGVVEGGGQLFYWQLLVELYLHHGLESEAEFIASQCLHSAQSESAKQGKLVLLIRMALCSFKKLMVEKDSNSRSHYMFTETVQEILEVDPFNPAVNLMQGIVSLRENFSFGKYCLQQVMDDWDSLGINTSVARQQLVVGLFKSKENLSLLKKLVKHAEVVGDQVTVSLYRGLEKANTVNISDW